MLGHALQYSDPARDHLQLLNLLFPDQLLLCLLLLDEVGDGYLELMVEALYFCVIPTLQFWPPLSPGTAYLFFHCANACTDETHT